MKKIAKEMVELDNGLILDWRRAVFIKNEKVLIFSDLHIGIEETSLVGIRVQTKEMIDRALSLINDYEPKMLVLNGDLKHSFSKEITQEWHELVLFVEEITRSSALEKIIAIKGNHDFYLKNIFRKTEVEVCEYFKLSDFLILHGDKRFELETKKHFLIIGDEHPSLTLRDEVGARFKLPLFLCFENLLVMPAFNKLSRGNDIRNGFKSPYLKSLEKKDLERAFAYAIEEEGKNLLFFPNLSKLLLALD